MVLSRAPRLPTCQLSAPGRHAPSCAGAWLLRLCALGSLAAMLALGGCAAPSTAGFGSRPPRTEATAEVLELERRMVELVNGDRAKAGRGPLELDPRLADVARAHAEDMTKHGFFSHDSPTTGTLEDRLDAAGYLVLTARENLASAPTIEKAEQNLLASPSHRANLEAEGVTHIGVGIVLGDRFGDSRMLTVTQVFAAPIAALDPAAVEQGIRQAVDEARRQAGLAPLAPLAALDGLAREHVDGVPLDLEASALERIGDAVAADLQQRPGHGLKAVQIAAQVLLDLSQFDRTGAPLDRAARKLGLATAAARDERGRPVVKALLLVGQ